MPVLADFAGTWHLRRRIFDALGPDGQFDGTARFDPVAGGLDYLESGLLRLGDAAPMRAERRSLWRAKAGGVEVLFADGRAFHGFDPGAAAPRARHGCAPDLYEVQYDFSGWPRWRSEWWVIGPRKDYRMLSDYAPLG